ncbi:MAG: O-succinylhomoserine sulfhydrylase [Proteobacteria bacterium]|nr:O-succinylhomoserine sulfhydrylase [Pseudomonadota bacterium]MDE3208117.1 O-succinylhomoserine sulfhydrylase [Pseudomonadota bacterium]
MGKYSLQTEAIRSGSHPSQFHEHSEALYLTSSFTYDSAAQAAAVFVGEQEGYIYSRFSNPTVTAMQERLAALEGAEACVATASGMSAILATVMAHLSAGDHILASASLFGSTISLFNNILKRFGIRTDYIAPANTCGWEQSVRPETKMIFVETPSNPLTELVDLGALSSLSRKHHLLFVVDNCFCSPAVQRPLEMGADLVIHSATKYLDGQGRVLGGAVAGAKAMIDPVYGFLRTAGPSISPFNAWVILKGMETLQIRMDAHADNALELAQMLSEHPSVERVYYPGLTSHPQHALAMKQQKNGGGIVAFEVKGGRKKAWQVIDACELISITGNLGDVKTTITHPASTTHARISAEEREAAGIKEGLVRISVGLESIVDLKTDLLRGLND